MTYTSKSTGEIFIVISQTADSKTLESIDNPNARPIEWSTMALIKYFEEK